MLRQANKLRSDMRIVIKKNASDGLESSNSNQFSPQSPLSKPVNSDPRSPLSPLDKKNKFNSLKPAKNQTNEQTNEVAARQSGNATPGSRPMIMEDRFIRKSYGKVAESIFSEIYGAIQENPKGEIPPVQLKRKRPQPPIEEYSQLSQLVIKKESEHFTPKSFRSPTNVKERFTFAHSNSLEEHSMHLILPKLTEAKKEREFISPKNRSTVPETKLKTEPVESKTSTTPRPKPKIRLYVNTESPLEDTQSYKQPNSGASTSPRNKPGRTLHVQTHREFKPDTERISSDNADEKGLKSSRKSQQPAKLGSFRQLIFAPQIDKMVFKRHLLMVHSGLVYATQFLRGPTDKFLELRQVSLAESSMPNLDETLIKSCKGASDPDRVVYSEKDGQIVEIPFKIRPFTLEFLKKLRAYYEIVIFTASAKHYAQAIIDCIDSEKAISYVLDRTYCMETKNGYAIKDLRIIKNRELKNMVIVDNLVHSFGLQIDNGIPILEWNGDKDDKELNYLADYLVEASYADDIREFNCERLKLRDLASASLPHILLQNWQ